MGRTSMDPGPNNGRGSVYSYGRSQDAASHRSYPYPAESVRSSQPPAPVRASYAGSNRGSYYPPESHRSYPPPPESQRSYHPPMTGSQHSLPLESHRSYRAASYTGSRIRTFDIIVVLEMLMASIFGIAALASPNWRASGINIFGTSETSYWVATQALATLGVVGMVIATILSFLIVIFSKTLRLKVVLWIALITQVVGALSMMLGCAVYGHNECGGRDGYTGTTVDGAFKNSCGYSYWFGVIAFFFAAQGVVFHLCAMFSSN